MKVLFMGTPDFSVPVLEGLIASDEHEIVGVVTQPDKARGRSGKLTFCPVKEVAVREGILVFQPVRIKAQEAVAQLKQLDFDAIVVVAFGQILSKEILDMPKYGCICVHASLLPRWRGAAPIQWSILAGDEKTGITTMLMDEGVDTGDILLKKEITIGEKETGGELFERMSEMGSSLLLDTLKGIESKTIIPQKQEDEKSTYAKMLTKELGLLDFSKSAKELECYIRGLNPWPSAYTFYRGKTLKVWMADVSKEQTKAAQGEIVRTGKQDFTVQTKEGCLIIKEVQLEGKKRMKAGDFLRGMHLEVGECLGALHE